MENKRKYSRGKHPNSRNGFKKGRIVPEEEKLKTSLRNKKLNIIPPSRKGIKHTEETKKKMKSSHKKIKYKHSDDIKKKISDSKKGINKFTNPNLKKGGVKIGNIPWNKGLGKKIQKNPYPRDFTIDLKNLIKKRDKNQCILCKRKHNLHVHHINYNKKDCRPENLITLCKYCHPKTNKQKDREQWEVFLKMDDKRNYNLSLAEMLDRLSILNLKSIILGCNHIDKKEAYEEEIHIIIKDINLWFNKNKEKINNWGIFIRAIILQSLMNRLIWENETQARAGGREQDYLLPFTHSVNSIRMNAGNVIANQAQEKKDLNLDRCVDEICIERGFDFGGIFDE